MTSWATTTDLQLHPTERAFLDASSDRHDRTSAGGRAPSPRGAAPQRHPAANTTPPRRQRGTRPPRRSTAIAILQRNHAADLAGQLAGTKSASAGGRRLQPGREDPQLALLLGLAAIDSSAASDVPALPEAIDALHWAIQSIRASRTRSAMARPRSEAARPAAPASIGCHSPSWSGWRAASSTVSRRWTSAAGTISCHARGRAASPHPGRPMRQSPCPERRRSRPSP